MTDTSITISADEVRAGALNVEKLQRATLLLHTRGHLILRNALPGSLVDETRERFAAVYRDCQESWSGGEQMQTSRRTGATFFMRAARWRIFPKLHVPFSHPQIAANAFVLPVLDALLGADFYCKYVSSDTCAHGAILQAPHRDFTDTDPSRCAASFIVNIPLMECGLQNGPLEVWPCGSHLWRDDMFYQCGINVAVQDGRNPVIEEFAAGFPSEKLVLHPGEILIRNPALWHRGTPNPSPEPRIMLTICYFRAGVNCDYGSPHYNLDRELFEQLQPRLHKLFAHAFPEPVSAPRRKRRWLALLTR